MVIGYRNSIGGSIAERRRQFTQPRLHKHSYRFEQSKIVQQTEREFADTIRVGPFRCDVVHRFVPGIRLTNRLYLYFKT